MPRLAALLAPTLALAIALAVAACGPKARTHEDVSLDADADWFADPPTDPRPQAPPPPMICGRIFLSRPVAEMQPSEGWVMVFASRSPGGPVIAGMKTKLGQFPLPFCLTQKQVIAPGVALAGSLWLSARIDGDGEPGLEPGDFDGALAAAVPVGTHDVQLVIDTFR